MGQITARAKYSLAYGGTYPDIYLPSYIGRERPEVSHEDVTTKSAPFNLSNKKWKLYMPKSYHPLLLKQHRENLQKAKKDVTDATVVSAIPEYHFDYSLIPKDLEFLDSSTLHLFNYWSMKCAKIIYTRYSSQLYSLPAIINLRAVFFSIVQLLFHLQEIRRNSHGEGEEGHARLASMKLRVILNSRAGGSKSLNYEKKLYDSLHFCLLTFFLQVSELEENRPIPVDFMISGNTGVLVITGPNTGGKTISLKTVGLSSLMAKTGHIPVQFQYNQSIFLKS